MSYNNFGNANSGYDGFSMSNNARDAYESGEKPYSKWLKREIMACVKEINPDIYDALKKIRVDVLKMHLLDYSSWHHTSSYFNCTSFYSLNEEKIEKLTLEEIQNWDNSKPENDVRVFRGDLHYIVWGGTKKHPKPNFKVLEDVDIEEKGCFYTVINDKGEKILRKKKDSNGTLAVDYEEEKRKEKIRKEQEKIKKKQLKLYKSNSSKETFTFHKKLLKNGYELSQSQHMYPKGRKPNRHEYDIGIENFFKKGEKRIFIDQVNLEYKLEVFDGESWQTDHAA